MKSPFKFALPFLSLGLAAAAPALFADETTPPATPAVSAPAADQPADQAPPAARKGGGRGNPLKMLTEKLSLTPDQQQKVGDLLKAQREQMNAIRDDASLSDDDKRAKGREAMKSTRGQIRALLTEEQQKIFDTMPPMRGGRGGGGEKKPGNN